MIEWLMIVGLLNLLVGLLILKYLRRVWLQLLELAAYYGALSGMNWWQHSIVDLTKIKTNGGLSLRVFPSDGEHAKTDGEKAKADADKSDPVKIIHDGDEWSITIGDKLRGRYKDGHEMAKHLAFALIEIEKSEVQKEIEADNPIITFGPLNVGDMFNTKSGRWVKQSDEDALCVMSGVHPVGWSTKFKPTDDVVVLY